MKQIYLLKPMLFCFLLYLVQACYAISGFLYLRMPISEEYSLYDVRCQHCGDVIGQYEYTPCATYEKHIRPSTEFWGMTLYDENAHVKHLIVEAAPLTICEECLQSPLPFLFSSFLDIHENTNKPCQRLAYRLP